MAPSPPPILIEGLTKRLGGGVLAVDGLDLVVNAGQILGLAGPNGAGKSVTLKIMLGLVRPTSGRVELFGEPVRPGSEVLGRVGVLVDGPGFVPHLSGLENLRLAWRMTRRPDSGAELERAIEIAGLGAAIDRRYRTYSHGMRYRLGLAQALLGAPDLLLLDEPTTGLDPAHIREVRDAIATAAVHGATVVFCSHLLSEVERICTHTAVVQRGRLVASGAVPELVGSAVDVQLDVDDPDRACDVLADLATVASVTAGAGSVYVEGGSLRPADLLLVLDEASVQVYGFRRGRSLEDAYLSLVGGDARAA
ncbi:MAG TPA: ABC transporter ATP-binding protein [Solirubrobacteraceae bacterium]|jgi:ABC-2 type transport system ATP-binding protein|nr:ABC transporter ATP-binding protein [Solirubrobacteraceae bacterium]